MKPNKALQYSSSANEILKWCLSDLIPVGDDFYYATLYSRPSAPWQLVTSGLLKLVLQSGFSIAEPSVRLTKLHWWQQQLLMIGDQSEATQSLSKRQSITMMSPVSIALDPGEVVSDSFVDTAHPLIHWLVEFNQHAQDPILTQFVDSCRSLIAKMSVHASLIDYLLTHPGAEFFSVLGKTLALGFGNPQPCCSANALAHYWFIHFVAQKQPPDPRTSDFIIHLTQALPKEGRNLSLSLNSYLALATLWLKINRSALSKNHWFEPSAPRKLFTVWKTRLFRS